MTRILFPSRLSNVNSYHKERKKEYAGSQFCYCQNRGSYMSAHVLLNLLNELGKR